MRRVSTLVGEPVTLSFMRTATAFASCFVLVVAGTACSADETPYLLRKERVAGDNPTGSVVVEKSDPKMKAWSAKASSVRVWCFYNAVAFADIDGEVWAIDGLARGRVITYEMFIRGKRLPIRDMEIASGARREFLYQLNTAGWKRDAVD